MGLPVTFFARPDDNELIEFKDGPCKGTFIRIRRRISDAQGKRLTLGMFKGMRMAAGRMTGMDADATLLDTQKLQLWILKWGEIGKEDEARRPSAKELMELLPEHASQMLKAINDHSDKMEGEDALATDPLESGEPTETEELLSELDGSSTTEELETFTLD